MTERERESLRGGSFGRAQDRLFDCAQDDTKKGDYWWLKSNH
jgi:hypothetical protein